LILDLGAVAVSAEVKINGERAGIACLAPYAFDSTDRLHAGRNQLEIIVANTLSNYYSQFVQLDDKPLSEGGGRPERRLSGLIGPVILRVECPVSQKRRSS